MNQQNNNQQQQQQQQHDQHTNQTEHDHSPNQQQQQQQDGQTQQQTSDQLPQSIAHVHPFHPTIPIVNQQQLPHHHSTFIIPSTNFFPPQHQSIHHHPPHIPQIPISDVHTQSTLQQQHQHDTIQNQHSHIHAQHEATETTQQIQTDQTTRHEQPTFTEHGPQHQHQGKYRMESKTNRSIVVLTCCLLCIVCMFSAVPPVFVPPPHVHPHPPHVHTHLPHQHIVHDPSVIHDPSIAHHHHIPHPPHPHPGDIAIGPVRIPAVEVQQMLFDTALMEIFHSNAQSIVSKMKFNKKLRMTRQQLSVLQHARDVLHITFKTKHTKEREEIARQIGTTEKRVREWLLNHTGTPRHKKKQRLDENEEEQQHEEHLVEDETHLPTSSHSENDGETGTETDLPALAPASPTSSVSMISGDLSSDISTSLSISTNVDALQTDLNVSSIDEQPLYDTHTEQNVQQQNASQTIQHSINQHDTTMQQINFQPSQQQSAPQLDIPASYQELTPNSQHQLPINEQERMSTNANEHLVDSLQSSHFEPKQSTPSLAQSAHLINTQQQHQYDDNLPPNPATATDQESINMRIQSAANSTNKKTRVYAPKLTKEQLAALYHARDVMHLTSKQCHIAERKQVAEEIGLSELKVQQWLYNHRLIEDGTEVKTRITKQVQVQRAKKNQPATGKSRKRKTTEEVSSVTETTQLPTAETIQVSSSTNSTVEVSSNPLSTINQQQEPVSTAIPKQLSQQVDQSTLLHSNEVDNQLQTNQQQPTENQQQIIAQQQQHAEVQQLALDITSNSEQQQTLQTELEHHNSYHQPHNNQQMHSDSFVPVSDNANTVLQQHQEQLADQTGNK